MLHLLDFGNEIRFLFLFMHDSIEDLVLFLALLFKAGDGGCLLLVDLVRRLASEFLILECLHKLVDIVNRDVLGILQIANLLEQYTHQVLSSILLVASRELYL